MGCHSTSDAPSLRWRLCCCFAGTATLVALAALQSLHWQLCPCFLVLVLLSLVHLCCCQHFTGIFASIALGLLPSSRWHLAFIVLVSLPLLHWHLCHCCADIVSLCTGIVTLVMPASSPLLRWCHCLCCHGVSAIALHPFTAVGDLVLDFDRGLDRNAKPKLAQAPFYNDRFRNAITSLAVGDGFLVVGILQAATICLWIAYQCAETLFICLIWMWEAV